MLNVVNESKHFLDDRPQEAGLHTHVEPNQQPIDYAGDKLKLISVIAN